MASATWSTADIETDLKKILKIGGSPAPLSGGACAAGGRVVADQGKPQVKPQGKPKNAAAQNTSAGTNPERRKKKDKRVAATAAVAVAAATKLALPKSKTLLPNVEVAVNNVTITYVEAVPASSKPKPVKQRRRNNVVKQNAFLTAIECRAGDTITTTTTTTTMVAATATVPVKSEEKTPPQKAETLKTVKKEKVDICKKDVGAVDAPANLKVALPPNVLLSCEAAAKELLSRNLLKIDGHPEIAPPADVLAILEAHHIYPVKKKSARHANARFVCRLCIYHCDAVTVCVRHLKSDNHQALRKEMDTDVLLEHIPCPSDAQADSVETLLLATVSKYALDSQDVEKRKFIVDQLNESLKDVLPDGCELVMFGSSASGLAHVNSDLNMSLDVKNDDPNVNAAIVLRNVLHSLLKQNTLYANAEMNLEGKVPSIWFLHLKDATQCVIGLGSAASVKTTNLIQSYVALDERARVLCVAFRHWSRVCQLNVQERGTMPPHTFDLMVIFYLQHCEPPVLPVLSETTSKKEAKNERNVGYLWIEMLRFYALVFPKNDLVVCVRQFAPMTKTKKNWRMRIVAVEDPHYAKRNLTRCVRSTKVYDFIMMSLKLSFKYFGIPQLGDGPLFDSVTPLEARAIKNDVKNDEALKNPSSLSVSSAATTAANDNEEWFSGESNDESGGENDDSEDFLVPASPKKRTTREEGDPCNGVPSAPVETKTGGAKETTGERKNEQEATAAAKDKEKIHWDIRRCPLPAELLRKFYAVVTDEMAYYFIWKKLTGGKVPIVECRVCKVEGHVEDNCPEIVLPRLWPLPQMHPAFMGIIDRVCNFILMGVAPDERELKERTKLLMDLQTFIRHTYDDAQLRLFGSSCNGFGFKRSDLDICLTFDDDQTGADLSFADIVVTLASKLKKHKDLYKVIAIPTAKVPIVKFIHRKHNLDCDLSLYNTLAQHNTALLRTYSEIDPRVRPLGYTIKYFAKVCDIGDASRGSLSSYGYVLMMIYFLQQRKPPVLPVLQQLYDRSEPPPQDIVDGSNVWFFRDLEKLHTVWTGFGCNKESVGELWLGLLRFYTEEFNFHEHVISIRQQQPLTLFEKMWGRKSIAIEDPFNLSHNLGSGLSPKMNAYILKAFIGGRSIFGTPIRAPPPRYAFIEDYMFDPKQLTDGPPPNDRCCRACGHIGHVARECPRRRGPIKEKTSDSSIAVEKSSAKSKRDISGIDTQQQSTKILATQDGARKQVVNDGKKDVSESPKCLSNGLSRDQVKVNRSLQQSQPGARIKPVDLIKELTNLNTIVQQQQQQQQQQKQKVHQQQQRPLITRPPPGFSFIPPPPPPPPPTSVPNTAAAAAAATYMLQGQCLQFKSNQFPQPHHQQQLPPSNYCQPQPYFGKPSADMQAGRGQMRFGFPIPFSAVSGGGGGGGGNSAGANSKGIPLAMSSAVSSGNSSMQSSGQPLNGGVRFIPPFIPTEHVSMTASQCAPPMISSADDCWNFRAGKTAPGLPNNGGDVDSRLAGGGSPRLPKFDLNQSVERPEPFLRHQTYQLD